MGVKLWWRWLEGSPDLWKVLWERKYNATGETKEKL